MSKNIYTDYEKESYDYDSGCMLANEIVWYLTVKLGDSPINNNNIDFTYNQVMYWVNAVIATRHLPTIKELLPLPLHFFLLNKSFLSSIEILENSEKVIAVIKHNHADVIQSVNLLLLQDILDN